MEDGEHRDDAWPRLESATIRKAQLWLIALVAIILLGWALRAMASVLIPAATSAFV
ncbi:MAG: hypothetical protein H0T41_01975, partial [Rhodobacteraceae bacterium]|nr:hypothetical protein [Paracoccaceae bacterium]